MLRLRANTLAGIKLISPETANLLVGVVVVVAKGIIVVVAIGDGNRNLVVIITKVASNLLNQKGGDYV